MHVNKLNNKKYVGVTSKYNPQHRWNHGRGYMYNTYFYNAIEKYGWDDGFEHVILFESLLEEEAKSVEKFLIKLWRTKEKSYGYNLTDGGDGTKGYHPSTETREKLSRSRLRENLSEETLKRRSESLRGRKFTDSHKRKIGDANSKPVIMLTKDDKLISSFSSAQEAERSTGISHSHISQCCTGKRYTTGGYKWKFAQ